MIDGREKPYAAVFAYAVGESFTPRAGRAPAKLARVNDAPRSGRAPATAAPRQLPISLGSPPRVRARQGRRRQVDGGRRARGARGPRAAGARSSSRSAAAATSAACSGRRPLTSARPRTPGLGVRRDRPRRRPARHLRRPRARHGGVPPRPAARPAARRAPGLQPHLRLRRRRDAGAVGAAGDRQDLGAGAAHPPYAGLPAVRRRDRRRATPPATASRCLQAPRTFAAAASVGPIARQARDDRRDDRRPGAQRDRRCDRRRARRRSTRRSSCATPLAEGLGRDLDQVIVNGVEPATLQRRRRRAARGRRSATAHDRGRRRRCGPLADAIAAARRSSASSRACAGTSSTPTVTLPQLFVADPGTAEIEHLARPAGAAPVTGSGAVTLERRLSGTSMCICVGSGGVGKTTVSAALALGLARARPEGRGRHDRPGAAAGHLARPARSSTTSPGWSTRSCCVSRASRPRASCGR